MTPQYTEWTILTLLYIALWKSTLVLKGLNANPTSTIISDKPLSFWLLLFETGTENVIITPGRRQLKALIQSTNLDQKSLETVLSIGICRPTCDNWQSKTLFLAIFDLSSSIVKCVIDCRLSGVIIEP